MDYMAYFLVAIVCLFLVVKLFSWPLKILFRLLANAVLGAILLFVVNFFGAYFNFSLPINWVTVLIAGFLGVPGVIFLIIFKLFL